MYRGWTVGVVVPAYNEEGFVGEVIETVPAFVDRVYVIDDGSTDDTWTEIRAHADESEPITTVADGGVEHAQRVVPIRHERNQGVGASIVTGYHRAVSDGVDVAVVMNGDGQMDPGRLPDLLDPIVEERAEYAKGNRLMRPEHRAPMTTWRLFGNALLSGLTKVASGYWKTADPQNGYTAISHEALSSLRLSELYTDYGFCNDVLIQLNARGMRVADVTMPAIYGDEESTIRYSSFVPGLSALLLRRFCWRLWVRYGIRESHPLLLLYALGAGTVAGGTALVGAAMLLAVLGSGGVAATGVGGLLLTVVGTLALVLAMTIEAHHNADLEVRIDDDRDGERTGTRRLRDDDERDSVIG